MAEFEDKFKDKFEDVQPLVDPEYKELSKIGRCLHFYAYEGTLTKKFFKFSETNAERLEGKKVLWFSPKRRTDAHNRFGNVTFFIDWNEVIHKFGENLFKIDQMRCDSRTITRVLLAKPGYKGKLNKIDLSSESSALKKSDAKYEYALESDNKIHELHIAIEVDKNDCKWLFEKCKVEANNHSKVNELWTGNDEGRNGSKYKAWQCYKYNNFGKKCEYQLKNKDFEILLKRKDDPLEDMVKRMSKLKCGDQ